LKLGQRYGKLVVLGIFAGKGKSSLVNCQCDCGRLTIKRSSNLAAGHTQSCGCLRRQRMADMNYKHGAATRVTRTPAWRVWRGMHQRCSDPGSKDFSRYGGRGIMVCPRWSGRDGFTHFLQDMGERPRGKTLDRKNGQRGYTPENCRWATPKEQAQNRGPRIRGIGTDHWSHRDPAKALRNLRGGTT
jgi:hypothetical protein